jgi:CBS domain-containing protein
MDTTSAPTSLVDRHGSAAVRWAPLTMSLRRAAETLAADEIGLLLVRNHTGQLCGVVSERDIVVAVSQGEDIDSERVEDIMADSVVTAPETAGLREITATMVRAAIRHVVVVDEEGEVAGVVSARDVMRAWHDQGS